MKRIKRWSKFDQVYLASACVLRQHEFGLQHVTEQLAPVWVYPEWPNVLFCPAILSTFIINIHICFSTSNMICHHFLIKVSLVLQNSFIALKKKSVVHVYSHGIINIPSDALFKNSNPSLLWFSMELNKIPSCQQNVIVSALIVIRESSWQDILELKSFPSHSGRESKPFTLSLCVSFVPTFTPSRRRMTKQSDPRQNVSNAMCSVHLRNTRRACDVTVVEVVTVVIYCSHVILL